MIPPQLFVDGKLVRPGERIGKGGEGEVFALADGSGRAVKIYSVADTATSNRRSLLSRSPSFATVVVRSWGS